MPEVKSAKLKVESADLAMRASKGNLYPRISLAGSASSNYSSASDTPQYVWDGTYNLTTTGQPIGAIQTQGTTTPVYGYSKNYVQTSEKYGTSSQLNDNISKQIGLNISIPIFNGLTTRTTVQRAQVTKDLANITVAETQNTLRQNIETAYTDALAASKTYNSALRQVKAQQEAYRMNKQRFESGSLSYTEYRISENDLFQAKSDLTRAKYNFILKNKTLDFYQGKQLEF
jgi:outer membrane protein